MNRNCLTVLSVVLVLTMASTHGFAGSQWAPDVTGEMGQFSYPGPADFKNAPLLAMTGGAAGAKDVIAEDKEEEMSVEQIAELMANPFSHLWF